MVILLRSAIFNLFFVLWTLAVTVFFLPSIFMPVGVVLWVARLWARGAVLAARLVCNIRWEVRGRENIPPNEPLIIAAKHQSAWETVVMYLLLDKPLYVLKKELKYIPLFGWYTWAIKCVAVDRAKGAAALKSLLSQALARLKEGRQVIIFPEGTRIADGAKGKYHPGISAIYEKAGVRAVPMVLNSGKCWPKNSFRKYPGMIVFEFLPPIAPGMGRKKFLSALEESLEEASRKLP